jgi:hypothetical protein
MRRFAEAYSRHYFRIMPLLMRAFVISGATMFAIVAIAQLMSGNPFTENWALTYGVALLLFSAIWLASKKVQQMGPGSK